VGHVEEPVGELLWRGNGRCLANKDKEGCLERILGIVIMAEDPATDTPHHRTVALYKGRKRNLVAVVDVIPQQLSIGQRGPIPQENRPAKLLQDPMSFTGRHVPSFAAQVRSLL
jgi:hypothetical protein